MKVLVSDQREGFVNFGTKHQYYRKAYTIEMGSTGKIYIRDEKGLKLQSASNNIDMTSEKDVIDLYKMYKLYPDKNIKVFF